MWKRFKLIMQYLWKNYKKMNGLADQFTKVEKKHWTISSQHFIKSDYLLSCIAIVVGASQDAPFKPLSPLSFSEDTSNRAFLQNCGKMILNFWIRPLALKLNLVSATNSWLNSFKSSLLSRLAKYLSPPHHSTQSSTLHLVWGRMYEYAKFLLCFLNKVKSTCLL